MMMFLFIYGCENTRHSIGVTGKPLSENYEELKKDRYLNEIPDEVEMPLLDHLEEMRTRILYSLGAICFNIFLYVFI